MRISRRNAVFILIACQAVGAEDLYVRSSSGEYGLEDGSSYAAAFDGFADVQYGSGAGKVSSGDTLYVCGTITAETLAPSGATDFTVDFRCPGDPGKIRQVNTLTEAATGGNWTEESANIWYLDVSGYTYPDPRRLWADGSELFPSNSKANLGTAVSGGPVGYWFYDSATTRLYFYNVGNPASTYTTWESLNSDASHFAGLILNSGDNGITLINPDMEGGQSGSIYVGAGVDGLTIYGTSDDDSGCLLGTDGTVGVALVGGASSSVSDPVIHDCSFDPDVPVSFANYQWEWNASVGDGLRVTEGVVNGDFYSNTFTNWPHNGIYLHNASGQGVRNNKFRANTFTWESHVEYGRCFSLSHATASGTTGNLFTGNYCENQPTRSQICGDSNYIVANKFLNGGEEQAYDSRNQAIQLQTGNSTNCSGNVVANNLFKSINGECIRLQAGSGTLSGNIFANNILDGCGSSPGSDEEGMTNIGIRIDSHATIGVNQWLNNDSYNSGTTTTIIYQGSSYTVSAWQSACTGGDVCSGNVATNPNLNADHTLPEGSALLDAGASVYPRYDYRGGKCAGGTPDIGPHCNDIVIQHGYTMKPKPRR